MNFIGYEDENEDLSLKLETNIGSRKYFENFDEEFGENPFNPFTNPSELGDNNFNLFNSLLKEESEPSSVSHSNHSSEQLQTFQNTRVKKEELSTTPDDMSVNCSIPDPISTKSKRIQKRERAKQRNQAKIPKVTEEAVLSGDIPAKYIPEGFNQANLDEKTRKKMLQMIRNRISAQNSRDRKRNLIDTLENQQKILNEENLKLKCRVRQLEEVNAQLQKENQEYKKVIKNTLSFNKPNILGQDTLPNDFLQNGIFAGSAFDSSDTTTNPSNKSPDLSANSSPVIRRSNRSGGFMKYSLALATIFAIVMFTGMNSTSVQQTPGTMLSVLPQQPVFQVPAPKIHNLRILDEKAPKEPVIVESKSKELMLRMEEEILDRQPCVSTNLEDYPFINQLNNLQQNFNEKHMSKFFNQLKMVNPISFENNQQSLSLNTPSNQKAIVEYSFSSYLRSSRRQLPDYSKPKAPTEIQLALPFSESNSKIPILKKDNFSSLFCPTGFEFQLQEDDSYIKVEDGVFGPQSNTKLKMKDAEWLQLFIPKNNVSIARMREHSDLIVSSVEDGQSDDNAILEIWCKVFFVRELPSNI